MRDHVQQGVSIANRVYRGRSKVNFVEGQAIKDNTNPTFSAASANAMPSSLTGSWPATNTSVSGMNQQRYL